MRTGKLTDDEWPRLTEAIEKLRTVSLHIDETLASRQANCAPTRRRLARQCGKLGLIVVDYLQLERLRQRQRRQPCHRTGRNLRGFEDAGQGTAMPGDCAVAAQPFGGAAH